MKLNKIQTTIYAEYISKGRVWADCPRQCGKTTLLIRVIKEAVDNKQSVGVFTPYYNQFTNIKKLLVDAGVRIKDIGFRDSSAEVLCYDELHKEMLGDSLCKNQKIICVRTRAHPLFIFNYLDLDGFVDLEFLDEQKMILGEDNFNLEYMGGLNEK